MGDKKYNKAVMQQLASPMVQRIVGLGCNKDIIIRVLDHKLEITNDEYADITELIDDILAFKRNKDEFIKSLHQRATASASQPTTATASKKKKKKKKPIKNDPLTPTPTIDPPNTSSDQSNPVASSIDQSTHDMRCKVCLDKEYSIAFLPCGHLACCEPCASELNKCCICNTLIRGPVKVLFS